MKSLLKEETLLDKAKDIYRQNYVLPKAQREVEERQREIQREKDAKTGHRADEFIGAEKSAYDKNDPEAQGNQKPLTASEPDAGVPKAIPTPVKEPGFFDKVTKTAKDVGSSISEKAKDVGSSISEKAKNVGSSISEKAKNVTDFVTNKPGTAAGIGAATAAAAGLGYLAYKKFKKNRNEMKKKDNLE